MLGAFCCRHMVCGLFHTLFDELAVVGYTGISGKSDGPLDSCMGRLFVLRGMRFLRKADSSWWLSKRALRKVTLMRVALVSIGLVPLRGISFSWVSVVLRDSAVKNGG